MAFTPAGLAATQRDQQSRDFESKPMLETRVGEAVAAARFEHAQTVAAAVWTVNHNLGIYPVITVQSTGRVEVEATVVHLNENQVQVSFETPYAGFVQAR